MFTCSSPAYFTRVRLTHSTRTNTVQVLRSIDYNFPSIAKGLDTRLALCEARRKGSEAATSNWFTDIVSILLEANLTALGFWRCAVGERWTDRLRSTSVTIILFTIILVGVVMAAHTVRYNTESSGRDERETHTRKS